MATFKLPQPADNISSATVLRWLIGPGDSFKAGDWLIELEAEESLVTIKANEAGVLIRSLVSAGETLLAGAELAHVEMNSETSGPQDTQASQHSQLPHSLTTAETIVSDETSAAGTGEVVPILMPLAGNTMEEGTVLEWRVKEGDILELGQVLCEIETDKATMEYESPVAGRLARIVAKVNQPIAVKELIAVVADGDAAADAYLAGQGASSVATGPTKAQAKSKNTPAEPNQFRDGTLSFDSGGRIKASPAARRLASEQGLALDSVGAGSGPGGRILSGDLARAAVSARTLGASPSGVLRRPMSKMRRAIGTNLQSSKQTIPHFYLRLTINAASMQAFYREQKPLTNCSLNDLVVLAAGRAMRDFPAVRSQIDGDEIAEFPHANIGIAVGVDDGLVVPVVLNVDTLSLAQLAQESKRVVEAGRNGVLENYGKGNFTISNLGMFGVEEFSAIINPPESGILAVSAIRESVIVENGSMRPGHVMTLTLSADHRLVDGLLGAKFMGRLKEILENPATELS